MNYKTDFQWDSEKYTNANEVVYEYSSAHKTLRIYQHLITDDGYSRVNEIYIPCDNKRTYDALVRSMIKHQPCSINACVMSE